MVPEVSEFGCVPENEWVLSSTIGGARRSRLLHSPPFERIVAGLLHNAQVAKVVYQRAPNSQPGHRCTVVLEVEPQILDVFFNSASGYRAQYFLNPVQGNRANRLVIDIALPRIARAVDDRHADRKFVESSLEHRWAKVWIHQGLWLRRAKREHRVLLVPTWQREFASEDKHRRKLSRWGALAPNSESRLLLKGGYVLSSRELAVGKPPSRRARELHDFGFT